jgi:Flp pilus assembly protein CpaB
MIAGLLRRRPSGWFAVAAVLATIAALATLRAAAVDVPMSPVVVAATDLGVGTRLDRTEELAMTVLVPRDGVLPGMFTSAESVRERVVNVPVAAGEPITEAVVGGSGELGPKPLAFGERAVSVPLAAAGAAAAVLVPGARVDAVSSPAEGDGDARVVVAAAEVLATTPPAGADEGGLEGAALLRVSERDALRLTTALDSPRGIRLLPRPVADGPGDGAP